MACSKQEDKKLIVGITTDYPPFSFISSGKIQGFDIDLVNAIGEKLHYQIEYKKMNFSELNNALEKHEIDLIASAFTITPSRLEKFTFSIPYFQPNMALVYKKSKLQDISRDELDRLEDIIGTVGVQTGTVMEEFLTTKNYTNFSFKSYEKTSDLLNDFKSNQINAIFIELLQAEIITQNYNNLAYLTIPTEKNNELSYGFAFAKDSKLPVQFNKIINELNAAGKLDILKLRWLSSSNIYSDALKNN